MLKSTSTSKSTCVTETAGKLLCDEGSLKAGIAAEAVGVAVGVAPGAAERGALRVGSVLLVRAELRGEGPMDGRYKEGEERARPRPIPAGSILGRRVASFGALEIGGVV